MKTQPLLFILTLLTGCATTTSSQTTSYYFATDLESRSVSRCQMGANRDWEMAKLKDGDRHCVTGVHPKTKQSYPTALMCDKQVGNKVLLGAVGIEWYETLSECETDYIKTLKTVVKFDVYARGLTDMGLKVVDSFDDVYKNLNVKVRE